MALTSPVYSMSVILHPLTSYKIDLFLYLYRLVDVNECVCVNCVNTVLIAGTPVVGHVDNLQKLNEMCKKDEIWLHVEG